MHNIFAVLFVITILFSNSLHAEENSIPIHGFFDINTDYTGADKKVKFTTGSLDFYFTKNLSDRIYILIDLVFETTGDSFIVDLERLKIMYDVNEYLTITSGKFHTPYGYWNTGFHHGLQIQTSILRPKFIAFEDRGGILPSHSVGMMSEGSVGDFDYNFYVTAGMHIQETNDNNITAGQISTSDGQSQDGNTLVGATCAYNFDTIKVGLHTFTQTVNTLNNQSSDVNMGGGFLVIEENNLEFYSEAYIFVNHNNTNTSTDEYLFSEAYYAQIAYDFDGIKPYIRVEYTHYNEKDVYFTSQVATAGGSYNRFALGLNYSLAEDANIKIAVVRHNEHNTQSIYYDALVQFAIRF
ncbi:hypothetical protein JHD47_01705 [Sulfurimonas sp. SAG-AH-194-L11]|nr:hypothetical protein [Sulfurimonas sp. SAG-AH-194-L11]MDF1876531.1 hypothetical protein [Sulfurimonas sp. SAG-AH-194-L11]